MMKRLTFQLPALSKKLISWFIFRKRFLSGTQRNRLPWRNTTKSSRPSQISGPRLRRMHWRWLLTCRRAGSLTSRTCTTRTWLLARVIGPSTRCISGGSGRLTLAPRCLPRAPSWRRSFRWLPRCQCYKTFSFVYDAKRQNKLECLSQACYSSVV